MPNSLSAKEAFDHVWKYFELHSSQRMSVFNFYISFSSLIAIPLMLTFKNEKNLHLLGILLGFLLFMLSVIFWRLDKRTSMLIKISEGALKQLENNFYSENDELAGNVKIFQLEESRTNNMKKWGNFPNNFLVTYRSCFNLVFFVFGTIGMLFLLYHLYYVALNPEFLFQSASFDISDNTINV